MEHYEGIIDKYRHLLKDDTGVTGDITYMPPPTVEYSTFKKRFLPRTHGFYEKLCVLSAKLIQITPTGKTKNDIEENLTIAHLSVSATAAYTAQYIIPFIVLLLGIVISVVLFGSLFFAFFFILFSFALVIFLGKLPSFFATSWRLKASNQMVLCIFYTVTYMKHTSNLENALRFASQYLSGPLATDLARVLEDGLTKYNNVQESLNKYLLTWSKYNMEFVHSFTLIQRSLLESTEVRRKKTLERALTEILDETQEKMLHYAQNLKGKIMALHMMGVVLPILGLVILPLLVSFVGESKWYHIATVYNILIPLIVYVVGKNILNKRPTGYGDTDLSETRLDIDKNMPIMIGNIKLFSLSPLFLSLSVGLLFLFIALSPILLHAVAPTFDVTIAGFDLLGYKESGDATRVIIGPFGLGAAIISLFFPLALAFAIGIYYKIKIKNLYSVRTRAHSIEAEFSTSLYQLGNILAEGQPPERAFIEAAELMKTSASGKFFRMVSLNISRGMNYEQALFDKQRGAMVQFPSNIINSSMRILVESAKKSTQVAAEAMWGISTYIKDIHRVNERLKDLLAEIIGDMKAQIAMLTPAIAGIVVGITSMITFILGTLSKNFEAVSESAGAGTIGNITNLFGDGLPTYYFQLVVGIYVVQIIFILTQLRNGIENGADKIGEQHSIAANILRSPIVYCMITLIVMLLFNLIASSILTKTTGM